MLPPKQGGETLPTLNLEPMAAARVAEIGEAVGELARSAAVIIAG